MAVTLKQIAQISGVSRGTVDRALHNRGRVNPAVAAEIRRIADELGYHPNRLGQALAHTRHDLKIGVIVQSIETPTMQVVARGAEKAASELRALGVEVLIRRLESMKCEEQLRCIDELLEAGVRGLAMAPVNDPLLIARIDRLAERGIPCITFNSDLPGSARLCFVGMDNARSGQTAAGLVRMMLPDGGKVLPVTAHLTNQSHKLRYTSFAEEMARVAPGVQLLPLQCCFDRDDFAYEIMLHTLEEHPDLRAVYVAANGQHGVCQALAQAGRAGSVRVIAFDLSPINRADLEKDRLSVVLDQNAFAQGYQPPLLLHDLLLLDRAPESEYLYTDIVIKTKYNC